MAKKKPKADGVVDSKEKEDWKGPKPDTGKEFTRKTKCPISLADFLETAKAMPIVIGGQAYSAPPRKFASGSFGWYVNEKLFYSLGGQELKVQIGINLTIIGSKEAPRE